MVFCSAQGTTHLVVTMTICSATRYPGTQKDIPTKNIFLHDLLPEDTLCTERQVIHNTSGEDQFGIRS